MASARWTSLRWRLVLLALTPLLPVFGLSVSLAIDHREAALDEARTTVRRVARDTESELATRIESTRQLLKAMAADPSLSGGDFAACSVTLAAKLQLDDRRRRSFAVTGRDGNLLCSSDPSAPAVNYADREYFRRALETRQAVVGKPVIGLVVKVAIIPVAQPLLDANGEVQRMLLASIDLASLIPGISDLSPSAFVLVLSNEEGQVLYRWPDNDQWVGRRDPNAPINQALRTKRQDEAFEEVGPDGVLRIYAFAQARDYSPGSLMIRVGVRRDTMTAAADRELAVSVVGLTVIACLALFAALFISERLVRRPIALLAHGVGRFREGKLSERIPETGMSGELGGLAAGFNRMAAALQAQVARAESVIESAPDPIVIVDPEGRIAIVNARTETAFGYARAQLLGQPVEMLIPQWLHAAHAAQRAPYQEDPRVRATGAGRELLARRKDGTEFNVDVSLSPLVTPEGVFVISTVRDVTERKQAEQRIHAQLEHLKLLDQTTRATGQRLDLKSVLQIVLIRLEDSLPVDFGCVGLHDAAANTLRVASVGARSETLAHELTLEEQATIEIDQNGLSRCIQGQLVYEPDIGQLPFPFPARLARGGLGSMVLAPLRSESRVFGVLAVARREANAFSSTECEFLRQLSEHVALTVHQAELYSSLQQAYDDLRQTHAAAMQEERLRALGQMASGIAHDINNALSPVSLYTESLLETEQGLSERGRGYLETIRRAVDDVAKTVARMREFYRQRQEQIELAPVDANQMVQQVLDLTKARWSDMALQRGITIRAVTELAPDLPRIMGVESEIREALTNLVFNAVDAMPRGGVLTLRTRLTQDDAAHPAVTVEVADTGGGMDEATRLRCVEPFFTTKGERGTGLGLAMVFGMARRHNAALEIDSAPGAGTTMRLVFAVPAAVQAEPGQPAGAPDVPTRLRLLLVDDDPILLKSLRDTLETDGHFIVAASGGEAGIAAFRAALGGADPFAAVITDLGMPYVDGRRVAAAVKQASPATPVIMLTGWGQRLVADGDIPPHVDRVLAKPPRLREVREALASLCPIQQA